MVAGTSVTSATVTVADITMHGNSEPPAPDESTVVEGGGVCVSLNGDDIADSIVSFADVTSYANTGGTINVAVAGRVLNVSVLGTDIDIGNNVAGGACCLGPVSPCSPAAGVQRLGLQSAIMDEHVEALRWHCIALNCVVGS